MACITNKIHNKNGVKELFFQFGEKREIHYILTETARFSPYKKKEKVKRHIYKSLSSTTNNYISLKSQIFHLGCSPLYHHRYFHTEVISPEEDEGLYRIRSSTLDCSSSTPTVPDNQLWIRWRNYSFLPNESPPILLQGPPAEITRHGPQQSPILHQTERVPKKIKSHNNQGSFKKKK